MRLDAEHTAVLTMQQLQNFRQHAKFGEVITGEAQTRCTSITEASIGSRVPQELELIFRRGSQFETGADIILLLEVRQQAHKCLCPLAAVAGVMPSLDAPLCRARKALGVTTWPHFAAHFVRWQICRSLELCRAHMVKYTS